MACLRLRSWHRSGGVPVRARRLRRGHWLGCRWQVRGAIGSCAQLARQQRQTRAAHGDGSRHRASRIDPGGGWHLCHRMSDRIARGLRRCGRRSLWKTSRLWPQQRWLHRYRRHAATGQCGRILKKGTAGGIGHRAGQGARWRACRQAGPGLGLWIDRPASKCRKAGQRRDGCGWRRAPRGGICRRRPGFRRRRRGRGSDVSAALRARSRHACHLHGHRQPGLAVLAGKLDDIGVHGLQKKNGGREMKFGLDRSGYRKFRNVDGNSTNQMIRL